MRPAALVVMAAVAGFIGGNVLQLPELFDKVSGKMADNKSEPADFWSTPAIEGYGKIHYVDTPAFKPGTTAGLSNKIVFQINHNDGDIRKPNLGLERVARVTNLYYAAGVPLDQLKFVVSINGDAVSSALNNDQFSKAYGVDNPNLKLISELKKAGVQVTICDQSVAFHQLDRNWIDPMVTHTISSGTTVATLENSGYAFLML
ncbi:sulfur reduction protein DsrE [Pantoea agglomerans]|jgi:intracellular sulfur oxidation DsrE/DsrF family protein|uniref:Sulfur reduction protein DsrE n=2 Tax=Pantoea TaxID=53335 RepID=A0AAN1NST6_9GAMM|nr:MULTISPECIES: DsrE family protein [Pantoea]AVV38704.1 sulfur reduction protein DsrE [Pantoea vagans]KAA5923910.1 DsrE family protein [Pantoea sp. VH_8]KAA5930157.1 DsrE family protein [Pantoea sp. VH_4]KAA5982309.1 DsrE family protein [Pantoea sp. M_4]KAA6129113.1 DsrE family protein [Pantoea gossypiicola]